MASADVETRELRFAGLRDYLAAKFGPDAGFARIEPLATAPGVKGGGYGVPQLVRWRSGDIERRYVLETVRPGGFGHEDRADRAALVLRAFDDYGELPKHVRAVDAGAFSKSNGLVALAGAGEFFLLTEFVEGEPYARDLERIAGRDRLEPLDSDRALALADYLAAIHREPIVHETWYRRRLRELAGSGECIAGIADSYPGSGFPDAAYLERVEALVLRWRYRLRDRAERLRRIHGDFHPWNILFREGTNFTALDRSRGRYGEPADDVAALAINWLFFALRGRGGFLGPFADLFHLFWNRYRDASGDEELAGVIAPHFAFRALVLANPLWYPAEADATRRALLRFVVGVLGRDRFDPAEIDELLTRGET
ncbi:MAG TPA: phosphotransferase [Thermoanaerobaculia bacterium]|nr:phosphotransferase [Thermoanaerobaculia bacterium]